MSKYRVTFKGDYFDVSIEGDSPSDIVRDFVDAKQEIENAVKAYYPDKFRHSATKTELKAEPPQPDQPLQNLLLSDLRIPQEVKDGFLQHMQRLSNWDTLYLLLHYRPTGVTNKQLRSLSEELGKPIKYSWFDSHFHRRDNEGFVMSKRQEGREALYLLFHCPVT